MKALQHNMDTVAVTMTSKGARVWIQGVYNKGHHGPRYDVHYADGRIIVCLGAHGKRKVTQSKGGIIDLVGKKVTQAMQGCERAVVVHGGLLGTIEIIAEGEYNAS